MYAGFLVMSLVDDSHAGGNACQSPLCGHTGDIHGKGGHSGNIGKDAQLRDTTLGEALEFLKKVEEQW